MARRKAGDGDFFEAYKHPKWQKKRLEILERAEYSCERCGETEAQLSVHHGYYSGKKLPWDYEDETLYCLCGDCHEYIGELRKILVHRMGAVQLSAERALGFIEAMRANEPRDFETEQPQTLRILGADHADGVGSYFSGLLPQSVLKMSGGEGGSVDVETLVSAADNLRLSLFEARRCAEEAAVWERVANTRFGEFACGHCGQLSQVAIAVQEEDGTVTKGESGCFHCGAISVVTIRVDTSGELITGQELPELDSAETVGDPGGAAG